MEPSPTPAARAAQGKFQAAARSQAGAMPAAGPGLRAHKCYANEQCPSLPVAQNNWIQHRAALFHPNLIQTCSFSLPIPPPPSQSHTHATSRAHTDLCCQLVCILQQRLLLQLGSAGHLQQPSPSGPLACLAGSYAINFLQQWVQPANTVWPTLPNTYTVPREHRVSCARGQPARMSLCACSHG